MIYYDGAKVVRRESGYAKVGEGMTVAEARNERDGFDIEEVVML